MKKPIALLLALTALLGCLCAFTAASADEVWYVKTNDGKGLHVRDYYTGEVVMTLPYGTAVNVSYFERKWAVVENSSMGKTKLWGEYLVGYNPGKYSKGADADAGTAGGKSGKSSRKSSGGSVLSDSALGATTVDGLNRQYNTMSKVAAPYTVSVVPDTRTGTARLRWAPSKNATLVEQLPRGYELTVIAASSNWLMVRDETNGKIGYIAAKFTKAN